MIEMVEYGGWGECLRLSNGLIELVAPTEVGPRVIRLGFVGGRNLFREYPEQLGRTGDAEWRIYGGHRLWHAPEDFPRTYSPDNVPIGQHWDGRTLTLRGEDQPNGLGKELRLTLDPGAARVEVAHRLINRGAWAVELAPWALSVMAPGGRAIVPQEEFRPHPEALAPVRPVVLWSYTDMSDPRWSWGRRYVQLRQDPSATSKQKAGFLNTRGWAAYLLDGEVLLKRYPCLPAAVYPDMGCNTQIFTDPEMLELETLGPLTRLEPGAHVEHVERWYLARVDCGPSDEELDEALVPLVAATGA
ncbi:MAG TPA: hypothetical protein VFK38_10880 [Candidatus Limnocylindrales bacterium]|nr:hypothetical protein [Candidatus Limnocylindrales bacterium]